MKLMEVVKNQQKASKKIKFFILIMKLLISKLYQPTREELLRLDYNALYKNSKFNY
jgi:hypothetical protein